MIIDARTVPENETIRTDVCIVGAGIAGITLAREFIGREFRVCLLESGGLEPDRATQSLYWGENVGLSYYELDTARACCFGGSSHRWSVELGGNSLGVRLRPLDAIDFEERDWIPYSGWPFDKSRLDPFYRRAQSVCRIGPYAYDVEDWEDPETTPRLPLPPERMQTSIFQFGPRDIFFKDYKEEIESAENISTYVHANAVEIETDKPAQKVSRINVACLGGNRLGVSAKLFILALGGIDTPRLLLLSNKTMDCGLGNGNDLVGRFFMEHLHFCSGFYLPARPETYDETALYRIHKMKSVPIMGKLTLSEATLRKERLANYCTSILPVVLPHEMSPDTNDSGGVRSLKILHAAMKDGRLPDHLSGHLKNVLADLGEVATASRKELLVGYERLLGRRKKVIAYQLDNMTEQTPNPDSRVTLSNECDVLGRRRVKLDWRLNDLDMRSVVRAQEIMDEEIRAARLGSIRIELDHGHDLPRVWGGWHHMGTTRMHTDPRKGVVDGSCRVHDISNLYVAGPSLFPTGGYANPVLTVVALAIRLADHVITVLE